MLQRDDPDRLCNAGGKSDRRRVQLEQPRPDRTGEQAVCVSVLLIQLAAAEAPVLCVGLS